MKISASYWMFEGGLETDAHLYVPGAVDVFFLPDAEAIPYDICCQRAQMVFHFCDRP